MSIASVRKESERNMVRRAVDVMNETGVIFEKGKLEDDGPVGAGGFVPKMTQWVYRMEPPLDDLTTYETSDDFRKGKIGAGSRYAVRQVLDQEWRKEVIVRENRARQMRFHAGDTEENSRPRSSSSTSNPQPEVKKPAATGGRLKAHIIQEERIVIQKKDFFGRAIVEKEGKKGHSRVGNVGGRGRDENRVWVSYHEGFSNAVRRPVRVEDILRGL